jgi:hypothetical protein
MHIKEDWGSNVHHCLAILFDCVVSPKLCVIKLQLLEVCDVQRLLAKEHSCDTRAP